MKINRFKVQWQRERALAVAALEAEIAELRWEAFAAQELEEPIGFWAPLDELADELTQTLTQLEAR